MTPEEIRAYLVDWLRDRPPSVRALARRFPPGCHVRAKVPLVVPGAGEIGYVVSYFESGLLGVCSPDGVFPNAKAQCGPDDVELVEGGIVSREDVERALAVLESN